MVWPLIYASFVDIKTRTVSNKTWIFILLIGVTSGLKPSGILIAIAVFLIAVVTGEIGGSDVKLITAVSVSLGLINSLVMLFIACSAQLVFCLFLKLFTKKFSKTLPFVPFITFGYVTTLLL